MGLKPGYKQTEVGVIPEEWQVDKLGKLIEHTKGYAFKSSEYSSHGVRVIRVSDTSYDSILEENPVFVSESTASQYAKWRLRKDDLVISTVGSKPPMYDSLVGRVILITQQHEGALLNQNAVLVRNKQKRTHFQQILLSHFRTKRYLTWIESIFRGNANQASITLKELFEFRVPFPVADTEQRAIAGALGDVDALLGALEKLIAKKCDLKQAAMQQLLTGQKRLPGFSGEWEMKRLGDLAEIVMGQSPDSRNYNRTGEGVPLIQGNADIENRRSIRRVWTTEITKEGKEGDLLLTVRAPVGAVGFVSERSCLGRGVCALRASSVDGAFLFHALVFAERGWKILEQGSTFTAANSAQVAAFSLPVAPTISEQTAIAEVLSDMDAEIAALEQRLAKTRALKQGMMQELLTGKTRLV